MLDQLKVAVVSAQNVTVKDWKKLEHLAMRDMALQAEYSDAFISYRWFEPKWSILVHLGNFFIDRKDNQVYDAEVYQLVINEGLSTYFAGIVNQARQEEFDYLVIDPDKDSTGSLPTVFMY